MKPSVALAIVSSTVILMGPSPTDSPRSGPTREVSDQGHLVRMDLAAQVLSIDVPEDLEFGDRRQPREAPIRPTLEGLGARFVSGSMLAQKAKQFDDGLYAAVELAAQKGAGPFAGKAALLQGLARRLAAAPVPKVPATNDITAMLLAACRLGNVPVAEGRQWESAAASIEAEFLGNPLRSKPLGFYTWSGPLTRIFRQDRLLQTELDNAASIERLARALAADPRDQATYEAYLSLVDRLTNPHGSLDDLRGALRSLAAGNPAALPSKGVALFPASRSHEAELVMKLYGDRPIPEGFSLVDEMVRRIRSGQIDLRPTDRSGWYDYQTWALGPLVVPERMPEAPRLQLGETYRKQLLDLFKGVLALTRETHVKQLEVPAPAMAAAPDGKPPVMIFIAPELAAEPLVSYYQRRAASYDFIQKALVDTFGEAGLATMRRETAAGPVALDLAAELRQMRTLFEGAASTTARQLGIGANADERPFLAWMKNAATDPDLSRDARMMVPVFYDRLRRKTKVWAFLGWSERPVTIRFAKAPTYEVFRNGRKLDGKAVPEVHFTASYQSIAYPVTAEVYVDRLLDRDEFRKLCDTFKTRSAILEQLQALK